jgi:hypothetical protein
MNTNHAKQTLGPPSKDMLAGITIHVEAEEDLTVRPYKKGDPSAFAVDANPPTIDQLAGRYVLIEADEDLTIRRPDAEDAGRPEIK